MLTLAILGWRGRALMPGRLCLAIAAAGAAAFALSPQWWFPSGGDRELHWAAWEQVAGSSYVIYAAAVLLVTGAAGRGRWRAPRPAR